MGHIFISYSHKDKKYVEKLEKKLIDEGFDVWIDHRIDFGSQWPKEIQKQLDVCDAFIVVVSENAYKSEWVQNEVARAKRKEKPFFPLLLQGDPWLSVETIQYVDVHDGVMPPAEFYSGLERVADRNSLDFSKNWYLCQNVNYKFEFKVPFGGTIRTKKPYILSTSEGYLLYSDSTLVGLPIQQGTNLFEKYFEVVIREDDNTLVERLSKYGTSRSKLEKHVFNEVSWIRKAGADAGMSKINEWISFSSVKDGLLVEFIFVFRATTPDVYSPAQPPRFNRDSEIEIFPTIVSTFRWLRDGELLDKSKG